ncbi:MAG: secondary thiamine-phosphate synthase enzyme YjbQ [Thiomargarita sp.]|nr:secondary thiamine-phosphate synthase enzyme YjbQ [Thiomargarita sp.]
MSVKNIIIKTARQGLFEITSQINKLVVQETDIKEGLCTLFVQHTSASLLIQENADPAMQRDLENWLNRLIPENDPLYTHIQEGADDMPAHIKCSLTASHLSIPIVNNQLVLGTWQGIYLWEHRHHGGQRSIVIHISH